MKTINLTGQADFNGSDLAGLVQEIGVRKLEAVFLTGTDVTVDDIGACSVAPAVHTLEIQGEHFDNSICPVIVKVFPNLKRLKMTGCKITDFAPLHALERLVSLNLFSSRVGYEELKIIGKMTGLQNLCLHGLHETKVSEDGLSELFGLTNLVTLDVRGLGIKQERSAELGANFARKDLRISAGEYVAPKVEESTEEPVSA